MNTNGGFLISKIKAVQGRVFERLLAEAGIEEFNGAQGRILYVLWQQDDLPIVELSRLTGLAKTTLTGMLDRMEARGHIVRALSPADRRQVRIRLTPEAKALDARYREVSERMNQRFYKGFSPEEIRAFEGTLQRVLNNLEEDES